MFPIKGAALQGRVSPAELKGPYHIIGMDLLNFLVVLSALLRPLA
jgi:hypothetical protein